MNETVAPPNPIYTAELTHLGRFAFKPNGSRVIGAALIGLLGIGVIVGGGLLLLARSNTVATVNARETFSFFGGLLRPLTVALGLTSAFQHWIAVDLALRAGANSIRRERESRTWDLLLITPVTAWSLVIGKWWAVVVYVLRRGRHDLPLRAGFILWLGVVGYNAGLLIAPVDVFALLIAPLIVIVYTVLNVMLAAALGVALSSLIRSMPIALVVTICAYALAINLFLGAALLIEQAAHGTLIDYPGLYLPLFTPALAPLDGGTLSAVLLLGVFQPQHPTALALVMAINWLLYLPLIIGGVAAALLTTKRALGRFSPRLPTPTRRDWA